MTGTGTPPTTGITTSTDIAPVGLAEHVGPFRLGQHVLDQQRADEPVRSFRAACLRIVAGRRSVSFVSAIATQLSLDDNDNCFSGAGVPQVIPDALARPGQLPSRT